MKLCMFGWRAWVANDCVACCAVFFAPCVVCDRRWNECLDGAAPCGCRCLTHTNPTTVDDNVVERYKPSCPKRTQIQKQACLTRDSMRLKRSYRPCHTASSGRRLCRRRPLHIRSWTLLRWLVPAALVALVEEANGIDSMQRSFHRQPDLPPLEPPLKPGFRDASGTVHDIYMLLMFIASMATPSR